ncbi:uncharacterized protein LOC126842404 [Adelges cooleyi]|uniref:uncharacterized protein LOC126842404 n=1 Tax=Adelges cooleyi TaxID=133065 RepID=UPI00217F3A41|nr:uncharacterized protein LOC126842404 [Adelges cooleyi]
MKLVCIMITLAFVNVSPILTADYANSVYTTNKYIKEAFDNDPAGLETAISNIMKGDKPFDILNLMLAIPDKANYWFSIEHDDAFISTLPEQLAIVDQVAVQEAIYQVTKIHVPQLGPNENFENDSLVQLGEERRRITGKVTKKLLIAAIDAGAPRFPNLNEICNLIGLLQSMRFPDSYIKSVFVDPAGIFCMFTSLNGRIQHLDIGLIDEVNPIDPYRVEFMVFLREIQNWFL